MSLGKQDFCEKCRLYKNKFVRPSLSGLVFPKLKLLIIVDMPTKNQVGKDISAGYYSIFFEVLKNLGFKEHEVYITSLIKCVPFKRKDATKDVAKRCYKLLQKELEKISVDKILLLGEKPAEVILDKRLVECNYGVLYKDGKYYGVLPSLYYYFMTYKNFLPSGRLSLPSVKKMQEVFRDDFLLIWEKLQNKEITCSPDDRKINFEYNLVSTPEDMINIIRSFRNKYCTFDLETYLPEEFQIKGRTALDWYYGNVVIDCCSFVFFQNLAQTTYKKGKFELNYDPKLVYLYNGKFTLEVAKALKETKNIGANLGYDTGVIYKTTGVKVPIFADTLDTCYLLNQERRKFSLQSLAYEYVPELSSWAGEIKIKSKKSKKLAVESDLEKYNYCVGDSIITSIIYFIGSELLKRKRLDFLGYNVVFPVKNVLRDMEANGLYINKPMLLKVKKELSEELKIVKKEIANSKEAKWYKIKFGEEFNPLSYKQLVAVYSKFFPQLSFTTFKKEFLVDFLNTKEGKGHKLTENILKLRYLAKKYSTYVEGLIERIDKGFAYASFKSISTRSGRTSSGGTDNIGLGGATKQINIQNIPRESEMRSLFRARPGYYLCCADYSQIEVRVAGAYAKSSEIKEAVLSGLDLHSIIASMVFNKTYEEILEDKERCKKTGELSLRQATKAITFGILYGMTAFGLAKRLSLKKSNGEWDIDKANDLIKQYFSRLRSVAIWIEKIHKQVKRMGKVKTVFGRERCFEFITDKVYRQAVNTYVQATASDIFLMALNTIYKELQKAKVLVKKNGRKKILTDLYEQEYVRFWGEVHDEVILEVHESIPKEWCKSFLSKCMSEKIYEYYPQVKEFMWGIPLEADAETKVIWSK